MLTICNLAKSSPINSGKRDWASFRWLKKESSLAAKVKWIKKYILIIWTKKDPNSPQKLHRSILGNVRNSQIVSSNLVKRMPFIWKLIKWVQSMRGYLKLLMDKEFSKKDLREKNKSNNRVMAWRQLEKKSRKEKRRKKNNSKPNLAVKTDSMI